MAKRNINRGLDDDICHLNDKVLEIKFEQTAEYVRDLEKRIATLEQSRQTIAHHPGRLNQVTLRRLIPSFVLATNLPVGTPPSLITNDMEKLKKEQWQSLSPELGHLFKVLRDFQRIPDDIFRQEAPDRQTKLVDAQLDLYTDMCRKMLGLYRDFRDRLCWELAARNAERGPTVRQRDLQLRNTRIKELYEANKSAGPAELFQIVKNDQQMKQILSRGSTKLKSKETVRNIVWPRKRHGKSESEFTAARATPRENRYKVGR